MSTLIKLRRDTAANWAAADPVLQLGEPGYDITNNELRIGDGTTAWSGLTPIAGGGGAGGNAITQGGNSVQVNTDGTVSFPGYGKIDTATNGGTFTIYPNTSDTDYSVEMFISYDNDVHIQSGNVDKGIALGKSYGSGAHVRIVGNVAYGGDSVGDVIIQAQDYVGGNAQAYRFGVDGVFTLPNGGEIDNDSNNIEFRASNNINLEANGVLNFYADNGNYQWQFDDTGNITVPSGGAIQTAPGSDGNIFIHPDGNGRVIIQGSTSTLLTLSSDVPDTQNRFEIDTYGNSLGNIGGGVFTGTYTRPGTTLLQDDRLASFNGKGSEDGVTIPSYSAGRITIDAGANWSVGSTPSHISFWTTPLGSNTTIESVRITPTGNLLVYTGNVIVFNGYVKTGTFTAATLPTGADTEGARAMVSDADSRTWGNLVVGGAGNTVPVWSDGSNWYIG